MREFIPENDFVADCVREVFNFSNRGIDYVVIVIPSQIYFDDELIACLL